MTCSQNSNSSRATENNCHMHTGKHTTNSRTASVMNYYWQLTSMIRDIIVSSKQH